MFLLRRAIQRVRHDAIREGLPRPDSRATNTAPESKCSGLRATTAQNIQ
ncbi:hypothetical protein [Sporofaciens musculi]|nr:hypothetical protein [Sporofaciens musculi]